MVAAEGRNVINVAWTGIAANWLPDGQTVTSAFRLNVQDGSRSSTMKRQSREAAVLRDTDVIIWDEAPMAPRTSLGTINSLLQDIVQSDQIFGGKIMVLGGDFRQILPVVERGTRGEIVEACIKNSALWHHFRSFDLHGNMRINENEIAFRDWLLKLGDGALSANIEVPEHMRVVGDLADAVFVDVWTEDSNVDLAEYAILTLKYAEALKTNDYVLDKLPSLKVTFRSQDEAIVEDPTDALNFPTEFLNKMTPTGLPPHELHLKRGCIVMLLKNLDVRNGLCNGTRLIVRNICQRILVCEFATGSNKGSQVIIHKIDNYYTHQSLPFRLRRRQHPIRLSFCMTINKSQGQSFERVGIDLREPIFSHGQLYVALSRARSRTGIFIAAPNNQMQNIVYEEVKKFSNDMCMHSK